MIYDQKYRYKTTITDAFNCLQESMILFYSTLWIQNPP